MSEVNYASGDDYVVEFLGYRFSFNGFDFEQRVVAAAVKLGLLEANELDGDEIADLVDVERHRVLADGQLEAAPERGRGGAGVAEQLDPAVLGQPRELGDRDAVLAREDEDAEAHAGVLALRLPERDLAAGG